MPAPGHVGNVNPKQEKALEAFRECLLNEQLISMENPPPYQETQLLQLILAVRYAARFSRQENPAQILNKR